MTLAWILFGLALAGWGCAAVKARQAKRDYVALMLENLSLRSRLDEARGRARGQGPAGDAEIRVRGDPEYPTYLEPR